MFANNDLPQLFVGEMKPVEIVVVEEVAKGAVADVMDQCGDPQEFFDIVGRRDVFHDFLEIGVQMPGEPSGHVHGAE